MTREANKRQSTAHSEIFRPKNNRTKVERIAHKLNAFAYLRLNQIERENSLVPEFDEIFDFFLFLFSVSIRYVNMHGLERRICARLE